MARRAHGRRRFPLEGHITFEPSRVRPACVIQAYAQVVPITRRTTPRALPTRQVECIPAEATWRKRTPRSMHATQGAIYARVSSEQQAGTAHTVASQVAALRERGAADGLVVPAAMQDPL